MVVYSVRYIPIRFNSQQSRISQKVIWIIEWALLSVKVCYKFLITWGLFKTNHLLTVLTVPGLPVCLLKRWSSLRYWQLWWLELQPFSKGNKKRLISVKQKLWDKIIIFKVTITQSCLMLRQLIHKQTIFVCSQFIFVNKWSAIWIIHTRNSKLLKYILGLQFSVTNNIWEDPLKLCCWCFQGVSSVYQRV